MFKKYCVSALAVVTLFLGLLPVRGEAYESANHDQRFLFCISTLREGYYQKTIDCLNDLMITLHARSDTVVALKYLGFCYGMLNRIDLAKEYFNKGLEKDPAMELDTLEFPPNITLIYNQLKLERKLQKLDTGLAAERKSPIVPLLMLGGGLVTAVAGGYFLMHAKDLYATYQKTDPPQSAIEKAYNSYQSELIKGCVFSGVSVILLPVSLYLLLHDDKRSKKRVSLMVGQDHITFVYAF